MKKNILIFIFLFCGIQYIYGQITKEIVVTCKKIGENGKAIQDDGVYDFWFYIEEQNGKKQLCIYNRTADNYYFIADSNFKRQWKWLKDEKKGNSLVCCVGFWGSGKEFNEIQTWHFQYQYEIFWTFITQRVLFMFEPFNNPNDPINYAAYEITSENEEEFDDFIVYLRKNIFEELK